MKATSPIRLISAGALSLLSAPLRGLIRWRQRSLLCRKRTIWIQLDNASQAQWGIGRRGFQDLNQIAREDDVRTVVFDVRVLPVGWSHMADFRQTLMALKLAGKSIFVLLQTADARAYALFSCADRIWVQTGLELFWIGLGGRHTFYGGLLDRYGVQADIEAAGSFKSFGEVYTRTEPSTENHLQLTELYRDLQSQMLDWISQSQAIELAVLEKLFQESPVPASTLEKLGLIDGEIYQDELISKVQEFTASSDQPMSFSSFQRWHKWHTRLSWGRLQSPVMVMHLEGSITDHEQGQDGIVADRVLSFLRELEEFDAVKTVVLYINSPGGSAMASDRIARGIERLKLTKNVVAVMGNVAASGGYYIASAADIIIASGHTITGSIGVVGGKLVLGKALETQQIQAHTIAAAADTDFLDWWTPFSDDQRARFRASLERTYERFCAVVSKGRTMPMRAVHEVAKGRVWTGRQALEHGLVDALGGYEELMRTLERLHPDIGEPFVLWHHRFEASGWRRWRKHLGLQVNSDIQSMVYDAAPLMVQLLHVHPTEPLALLPIQVEW